MSKRGKEMTILCSVYDVDFRSLAEEYGIGVIEDLGRKINFVLAEASYHVPQDQYDDHPEYILEGSNNMKEIADVQREVLRPEANRHVFCFALQFSLLYKALACGKVKSKQVPVVFLQSPGMRA